MKRKKKSFYYVISAFILIEAFYQTVQVSFLHKNVYVNFSGGKNKTCVNKNSENKMKKSEEKTFLQSLELKAAKKTFGVMVGNNGETILDVF